jgi:hypothetical protein
MEPQLQDSVTRLLTQAVDQYGPKSTEVRIDVTTKTGISDTQFNELFQYYYKESFAGGSENNNTEAGLSDEYAARVCYLEADVAFSDYTTFRDLSKTEEDDPGEWRLESLLAAHS